MIPIMYRSQDSGAPAMSNALGALVGVLDACLVTGYATQVLTSLTHSAGIITGTLAAHGYTVGQTVSISGAAQDEYNGRILILTVPTSGTFTYAPALSNPAVTPATGTLRGNTPTTPAALGYQLVATGSNVRLYRPRFGTRMYLAVDDTVAVSSAAVRAFESASAASIVASGGTAPFPDNQQSSTGLFWQKTLNVASTPNWIVLGDDKGFYYQCELSPPNNLPPTPNCNYFGDFISYQPNDAFNCILIGKPNAIGTGNAHFFGSLNQSLNINPGSNGNLSTAQNGKYLCRGFHQGNGGFQCYTFAEHTAANQSTASGLGTAGGTVFDYPYRLNNGIFVSRIQIAEPTPQLVVRGHMRGLYAVAHDVTNMQGLNMYQVMAATDGAHNMTLEVRRELAGSQSGAIAFETGKAWT